MSEGACAAVSTSTQSDYDLCWKNVIKINLEARQQVCVGGGSGRAWDNGKQWACVCVLRPMAFCDLHGYSLH